MGETSSFWTQANALLRKNLTFQKRNSKGNIRLISYPFILCLILVVIQVIVNNELDKPKNKCGCKCVDTNGDGQCEEQCGIQYSTVDQVGTCSIPNPPEWPPLLQIPAPQYRAVRTDSIPFTDLPNDSCRRTGSCPVTMLLTGNNHTLGGILAASMFSNSPAINTSDMNSLAQLVLGSASYTELVNYLDPAFFSTLPIYFVQSQCIANTTLPISIQEGSISFAQEVACAQGLYLWRNSSSEVNDELYKGYRKGNSERKINEFVAAYDFLDSDGSKFNVSIWYNSTYSNNTGNGPISLLRIPRSVNLVNI